MTKKQDLGAIFGILASKSLYDFFSTVVLPLAHVHVKLLTNALKLLFAEGINDVLEVRQCLLLLKLLGMFGLRLLDAVKTELLQNLIIN